MPVVNSRVCLHHQLCSGFIANICHGSHASHHLSLPCRLLVCCFRIRRSEASIASSRLVILDANLSEVRRGESSVLTHRPHQINWPQLCRGFGKCEPLTARPSPHCTYLHVPNAGGLGYRERGGGGGAGAHVVRARVRGQGCADPLPHLPQNKLLYTIQQPAS